MKFLSNEIKFEPSAKSIQTYKWGDEHNKNEGLQIVL